MEGLYYSTADKLTDDYRGGSWNFQEVPKSKATWLCLDSDQSFRVNAFNGNEVKCNAIVLSMSITLIMYSNLSFQLHEKGNPLYELIASDFHDMRLHFMDNLSDSDAQKLLRIID